MGLTLVLLDAHFTLGLEAVTWALGPGAALGDQGTWGVPSLLLFQVGWGYQLPKSGKYLSPTSGLPAQDAIPAVLTILVSCMAEEGGFPLHTPEAKLPNTGAFQQQADSEAILLPKPIQPASSGASWLGGSGVRE